MITEIVSYLLLIDSHFCATSARGRVPKIFCKYTLQPYKIFVTDTFTVTWTFSGHTSFTGGSGLT